MVLIKLFIRGLKIFIIKIFSFRGGMAQLGRFESWPTLLFIERSSVRIRLPPTLISGTWFTLERRFGENLYY